MIYSKSKKNKGFRRFIMDREEIKKALQNIIDTIDSNSEEDYTLHNIDFDLNEITKDLV